VVVRMLGRVDASVAESVAGAFEGEDVGVVDDPVVSYPPEYVDKLVETLLTELLHVLSAQNPGLLLARPRVCGLADEKRRPSKPLTN
jgi:hypothetical protein